MHELSDDLLITQARLRGLSLDREDAAALRPQLESLLGRLGRFAEILPRDVPLLPQPSAVLPPGDQKP